MNDLFVVPLTKGHFAIVDAEDAPLVRDKRWWSSPGSNHSYAIGWDEGRQVPMHRYLISPSEDQQVDHIDRNSFNNTKSNLRVCSRSQNKANSNMYQNNTSGYIGVTRVGNKWVASVRKGGKLHSLGRFRTAIEAARARDRAAIRYHGEFASLNFPEEAQLSG